MWAAAFLLCTSIGAHAAENRGIWFWTSAESPWGAAQVIGNVSKEATVLQFFQQWKIGRVYCSFSPQAFKTPALIRTWNEEVHAAGLTSQLLLSENTWILPANRASLLQAQLKPKLIDFNARATDPRQRFDALHLDIEPNGLPAWPTMTPAKRRDYLLLLRDTFQDVRAFLDKNGARNIPVYADLPVWFDQTTNPVKWKSTADRDAWFKALAKSLAGITLMAYERNTAAAIKSGVTWELRNFKGETRIGLEAAIGPGRTWTTFSDFLAIIHTEETAWKPAHGVDIHDFVQFYAAAMAN